jgi:hypothetical protein
LILGAAALVAVVLLAGPWLTGDRDTRPAHRLTQPLRLAAESDAAYRNFLLGLRTHHYRLQPRGEADHLDVFYDTADWDLLQSGYSYRFRNRLQRSGKKKYAVRLEREPRFTPEGEQKLDLVSDLPRAIGEAIAGGEWDRAVSSDAGLEAPERLRGLLAELGIAPERLAPRLVGELHRERFDVTDKGRRWFELDHEVWSFRPFSESSPPASVRVEDIVVDTRLKEGDPELVRRVRTMDQYAEVAAGVSASDRAPHERAVEALGRN